VDKIKTTISSLKYKLSGGKKKTPDASLRSTPEKEEDEQYRAKMEKAVSFFKQRQGGKKETPEVPLENTPDVTPQGEAEVRRKVTTAVSLQDDNGQKDGMHQEEDSGGMKETPEASIRSAPEKQDNGRYRDKIGKAMSFFKQRQGGKRETPEVFSENNPEVMPQSAAEVRAEVTTAVPLQDSDGQKDSMRRERDNERIGWISPTYSQSRRVHLDPRFVSRNRCLAYLDNVPGAEAYRMLRTQLLQRTWGTGNNTIMVTSALPGEGKTLTAINLAFTVAREFRNTVLLVDGDLRKQSIHKYLGCPGGKGLVDYLVDGSPVSELITWPGIEKITLISGERSFQESAEILGSQRMKELVFDMKQRYPERYIIFDVPPILTGADTLTFVSLVDLVIVVVQAGKTSKEDVKKALQFLPKGKVFGLVLNRC